MSVTVITWIVFGGLIALTVLMLSVRELPVLCREIRIGKMSAKENGISTPKVIAGRPPPVKEIHVVWMTTGLGCDGDSIAVTAATHPAIEDILRGNLPGLPKVHLHNPVLTCETGNDFTKYWRLAAEGKLEPFILILEGPVPIEKVKTENYRSVPGTSAKTSRPITTGDWIDRLAPQATAIICAGTCSAYGGIHAMAGNPISAMGLADYLGRNWKSKAGLPIVNVPGCPVKPDNLTETLLYLVHQVSGLAPAIPLDAQLRPTWLFGQPAQEDHSRPGRQWRDDFAHEYGPPRCLVKIGCCGIS